MPDINEHLLEEKLVQLEQARQWSPRVISKLETAIRTADDYDLFRINPIQYATEKGMEENESIDLFLFGSKFGLFEMEWHLLCPLCAHVVESFRELTSLHAHFVCTFCGRENDVSLDEYIQVAFTLSPQVRDNRFRHPEQLTIEDFCIRYTFAKGILPLPDGTRHRDVFDMINLFMAYVPAGEEHTAEFELASGIMQIKDLSLPDSANFLIGEIVSDDAHTIPIQRAEGRFHVPNTAPLVKIELPTGTFDYKNTGELETSKVVVEFANQSDKKSPLWIMHYPAGFVGKFLHFEPFLSGKRLLTTQTFRDLFRSETIQTDEGIGVQDITFLFTDLKSSTEMYDRIGDPKAYFLVRQHFDTLNRVVAENSGAIVKTIGDAVMASFMNPVDALRAALGMVKDLEAFNQNISENLILKIGIHKGHSIAVTLNEQLDYFGQTVNIAARVQGLADGGEICVSEDAYNFEGMSEVLAGYETALTEVAVKGVSQKMRVYRIAPNTA